MASLLKNFTREEKNDLFDALHYMKMGEIKDLCHQNGIPVVGNKRLVLEGIKHFLMTGDMLQFLMLPETSKVRARQGWTYLHFIFQFQIAHPYASKRDVAMAWEKARKERVIKVQLILNEIIMTYRRGNKK